MIRRITLFFLVVLNFPVFPQEEANRFAYYDSLSFEELLHQKITVATGTKGQTLRESPGILTIITAEEIAASGARDFIDILRLVPGFNFGMDVEGIVGLGVRGLWAHEGKVALLIDGQLMNEIGFATLQFGLHYPVSNIKKIEIIRGPGSAIYGGFAELAVINVVTKTGEDLDGIEVSTAYGTSRAGADRTTVELAYGRKVHEDAMYSLALYAGKGSRSDRNFTDFFGSTYDMKGASDLKPLFVNFNIQYRDLDLRVILDHYETRMQDAFFINLPQPLSMNFKGQYLQLKYDLHPTDTLTITPRFNFKRQTPWESRSGLARLLEEEDPEAYSGLFSDREYTRFTGGVTLLWDAADTVHLTGGIEYYEETADADFNLEDFHNLTLFAQALVKTGLADFTMGGRYENHNFFDDLVVPRFAATKVWEQFHAKFLASQAFRSPAMENIALFRGEGEIKAEIVNVYEVELGYQFSKNFFLIGNLFDITIKDPIVYFFDEGDAYKNFDQTGTRGIEWEARFKGKWGYLTAGYSYYTASGNREDQYEVRDADGRVLDKDALLGFPRHKATLNASFRALENFSINPSAVYLDKRWGYVGVTEDEEALVPERFDEALLLNINLRFENWLGRKYLTLDCGVMNVTNEKYVFIQPYYDGWHAPYPDRSREYFVRVSCRV